MVQLRLVSDLLTQIQIFSVYQGDHPLISHLFNQSTMGQNIGKPTNNPFQNSNFLNSFKRGAPSHPSFEQNTPPRPSIFATLRKPPVAKPNDFIPLFNDCISAASSRTQEYLLFKDPEDKFHPSPEVLTQVRQLEDNANWETSCFSC